MSNKLTKAQEIADSIMKLAEGIPLDIHSVRNLFVHNLEKHGIMCNTDLGGIFNKNNELEACYWICSVHDDKTHYYTVVFRFDKPSSDVFVLAEYDLDATIKTVEEN